MKIIFLLSMKDSSSEREYAATLYETYGKLMRYVIFQIVKDWEKADDLLQDAVCRLFPHLAKLMDWSEDHVRGYVCRAARSVALDAVDPKRRGRYFSGKVEALADESTSPEDFILKMEEADAVRGVLDELPERDRDLLFFKYFDELDNHEISRLTGISEQSIRQRLSEARRHALRLLQGREQDEK